MKAKQKQILIGIISCAIIFILSMFIIPYPANIMMMLGCFLVIMSGIIALKRNIKEENRK